MGIYKLGARAKRPARHVRRTRWDHAGPIGNLDAGPNYLTTAAAEADHFQREGHTEPVYAGFHLGRKADSVVLFPHQARICIDCLVR